MCFSFEWIERTLIWLVVVCAIVGILRLVLPFVLTQLGVGGGVILSAINIVIWAVVAIFVVIFCFDLISCLAGGFPLLHR